MELNKEEHGQTHAEQKSQEEEVESLAEEPVESRWEYPRPGTYDLRQQLPQGGSRQRQALAGSDGTDYQKMIGRKKAEKIETQTEQQNWPQASPFGTVNCRASLKALYGGQPISCSSSWDKTSIYGDHQMESRRKIPTREGGAGGTGGKNPGSSNE